MKAEAKVIRRGKYTTLSAYIYRYLYLYVFIYIKQVSLASNLRSLGKN